MRKLTFIAICLLMLLSVASAQTKAKTATGKTTTAKTTAAKTGKVMKGKTAWHCGAADQQQQYDAGDKAGHTFGVAQGKCTATSSTMGEKEGQYTQAEEINGDVTTSHGSFIVTMDDGDKTFYTYSEKVDTKKKTGSNTWKINGGTGKQEKAKASGSCTAKFNDDNSSDWTCSTGGVMKKMESKMKM